MNFIPFYFMKIRHNRKLNVFFLWHMHQPSYQTSNNEYLLPWTRLHAVKDYLGFARIVSEVNGLKTNINFTPVLWDQIVAYGRGEEDKELRLTKLPAGHIKDSDKVYLLQKLFTGNYDTIVKPFERYRDLYNRYGMLKDRSKFDWHQIARTISSQELIDLCVWRNLAWIFPGEFESDEELRTIFKKGAFFTEEEKLTVVNKCEQIIRHLVDLYRQLMTQGKIELTTTPYHHPILPILINYESARDALPNITLPKTFSFTEDAHWHVTNAIKKHEQLFNKRPDGMWPAEGSISPEAAKIFYENGIQWIASDEEILGRSAGIRFVRDSDGQVNHPEVLYRPWKFETSNGFIKILFRDHFLSDLIGFEYQRWDEDRAVKDFVSRLMGIRKRMESMPFEPIVSVILDGENAWEYYKNGGFLFLKKLFVELSSIQEFNLVLASEFLKSIDNQIPVLPKLASGSWINGNFGIWIGHPEENRAWDMLRQTKMILQNSKDLLDHDRYLECMNYIYRAEASDWFWWYGDDHYSSEKLEFDQLFRSNLIRIFEILNQPIPIGLRNPIATEESRKFKLVHPKTLLSPKIDGKKGSYFDWFGAGSIDLRSGFSAMHAVVEKVFESVQFGFDLQKFYLRADPADDFNSAIASGVTLSMKFQQPESDGIEISVISNDSDIDVKIQNHPHQGIQAAFEDVLEIAVPFKFLNIHRDQTIQMSLELFVGNRYVMRIPDLYDIEFKVPTEDYDSLMWEV